MDSNWLWLVLIMAALGVALWSIWHRKRGMKGKGAWRADPGNPDKVEQDPAPAITPANTGMRVSPVAEASRESAEDPMPAEREREAARDRDRDRQS